MSPQRRSALVSVAAAAVLVVLKLAVGLATHSLGLVSEAAHSGTDLVAALLTYFAIRVAARPADVTHQFGHGKAEHLSALAEATFLALVSLFISLRAIERLAGTSSAHVHVTWYAFAVLAVVIAIDVSRTVVSWRTSRMHASAALASNALHFGSDLLGSLAVLAGLLFAHAGHPKGDAVAALFVGVLVLVAASRLMKVNVDVLMDRAPAEAEAAALAAIEAMEPAVELRRLRMRQAGSKQFADVVIGVPPGAAVGQGHAAADAVENAVHRALPESDIVVHVEPVTDEAALRERVHASAAAVPRVREIHNIVAVSTERGIEVSLHLKLPGELSLAEAHEVASAVERAIDAAVPEVTSVQTHLEPLAEETAARSAGDVACERDLILRIVGETTGRPPRELRFLRTDDGLVAFLTLGLDPDRPLAEAHARASEIEERVRSEQPGIADVIVHTEP
jgi:cation diffusion facilitator family transporter